MLRASHRYAAAVCLVAHPAWSPHQPGKVLRWLSGCGSSGWSRGSRRIADQR